MHFESSLFTLIALLILANPAHNFLSAGAFIIPLQQKAPDQTSLRAKLTTQIIPPWEASAMCPGDMHWACHYYKKVYCACFSRGYPRPPKRPPSRRIASTGAEAENITRVEIMAEVQPGNKNTLISLFVMRCPYGTHVECQMDPGAGVGAHCGCFENLENLMDIWKGQDDNDKDTDSEEENQRMETEAGEDGDFWFVEDTKFAFQFLHWPRCPAGQQWYCCLIDTGPPLSVSEVAADIKMVMVQPKHTPPRKECFCVKDLQDPCPPF